MVYSTETSKRLFERALKVMIEGGSSASRGPATFGGHPLFMQRGQGAWLFDADGNRYIDWMMGYGALPIGHAHPRLIAAICQGISDGAHFAAATDIEIEVAEKIQKMVPSAERVRFANTGTEAAMAAIRLARGYTGRPKFIKFEGHYHGWYDDFLVNSNPQPVVSLGHRNDPVKIADSSGLNRRALEDTIVLPWNDLGALAKAIDSNRGRIAAIITEGIMANMGVIAPQPGFLEGLQEIAKANGILFILDETVTGFRIAPGGCQEYYSLSPDLTVLGKALGCGFPVAALVGRAEIMEALAWGGVLHYGTQNASRIGLHAANAGLTVLTEENNAAFRQSWDTAEKLCGGLRDLFAQMGIGAIVQNVGPMFQIMFSDLKAIRDYRQYCQSVDRAKFQTFVRAMFRQGVYMSPSAVLHSIVTLVHSEEDVALTIDAARKAFADGSL